MELLAHLVDADPSTATDAAGIINIRRAAITGTGPTTSG